LPLFLQGTHDKGTQLKLCMLIILDYVLPLCGVVAIIVLFVLIYANRTVLFTDYGLEREQAEIKRLNAEIKALETIIADKNKTILNLLNKDIKT